MQTIYTGLKYQTTFHRTTNPIYHRLISNPSSSVSELLALQKSIDTWQESIPTYFQPGIMEQPPYDPFILARYRLSWRASNFRIISFRPMVLRWAASRWTELNFGNKDDKESEDEECRLLCLRSARDTIASISEYYYEHIAVNGTVPSRLSSWYML
jgi:transcriptional regulatory protein GAL4